MATRTFVAKKIGEQYVVVPKNPAATRGGAACLVCGAALVFGGAVRRGLSGVTLTAIGVDMLFRGATGRSLLGIVMCPHGRIGGPSGDPRQSPTFQNDLRPTTQVPEDDVDEMVMESFPASDPPARTPTASP